MTGRFSTHRGPSSTRRAAMLMAAAGLAAGAIGCTVIPGATSDPPKLYDLTPKSTFDPDLPKVPWQLVIEVPVAAAALDSTRIALRRSPTTLDYYARAVWTDTAPSLVQTLLVESFENSGKIVAVGREAAGLRSDYILKTDLREFQAEYVDQGPPVVNVRINTKLVDMPERVIIANMTEERKVRSASHSLDDVVLAFDDALGKVMKRIVEWTLTAPSRPPSSTGPTAAHVDATAER